MEALCISRQAIEAIFLMSAAELVHFYGILKDQGKNTRFLFITGISKFSKMSIFSALNNLQDISIDSKYSQLLGITEREIRDNFNMYLEQVMKKHKISKEKLLKKIKYWYDGYSFNGIDFVYNPFSLLNFFVIFL